MSFITGGSFTTTSCSPIGLCPSTSAGACGSVTCSPWSQTSPMLASQARNWPWEPPRQAIQTLLRCVRPTEQSPAEPRNRDPKYRVHRQVLSQSRTVATWLGRHRRRAAPRGPHKSRAPSHDDLHHSYFRNPMDQRRTRLWTETRARNKRGVGPVSADPSSGGRGFPQVAQGERKARQAFSCARTHDSRTRGTARAGYEVAMHLYRGAHVPSGGRAGEDPARNRRSFGGGPFLCPRRSAGPQQRQVPVLAASTPHTDPAIGQYTTPESRHPRLS